MEDPAGRVLKERLVADPDFPFLQTIGHPVFHDEIEPLGWWHCAFLWEQRQMIEQPCRYAGVAGGLRRLLRDPERTRRFAARRADEFVAAFADLLAHGTLYFDANGDLKALETSDA